MKTAFLFASLALSAFALGGLSPAQDNNQPPPQSASLEDEVAQLQRQQQVMQWQLDDLRKQVAALQQAIDRLGRGGSAQTAESAPAPESRGQNGPGPTPATASSDEGQGGGNVNSYALFYTRLQSQGKWLQDPSYGYVWQPSRAAEDQNWRPYTDGHWVYTDRGWTWVSNEDFGWACYHYGRWARRSDTGWVWVPGNEWGPAWVSWREGEGQGQDRGYIGWAPLPPEAEVNQNVRIEGWADNYYDIGPAAYVFVRAADLAQPSYRRVVVPPTENETIIVNTRNVTNIRYSNRGFDVGGPDYTRLEQEANVRIPRYNLAYTTPERGEDFRTVVRGNQLEVYAPPQRLQAESAARPEVARTLTRATIDRGWRELDQTRAAELRQTFERQAPVPPGLPPSRVERARTAAGEVVQPAQPAGAAPQPGTTPGQAVGAAAREGATPARAIGAPAREGATPAQAVGAPAREGATPAQAVGAPAREGATPAQAVGAPGRAGTRTPQAEATPAQAEATPAARTAATPQGRAEPQRAASPAVARGNATPEPRPANPDNRQERDLERRTENENGRTGEPARTSREAERPAVSERATGNQPAREPSSNTNEERSRSTPAVREQSVNAQERREAPKREEEAAGTERSRETSRRETPATGTGEAEKPKHEAGERGATTSAPKHVDKENGASERESQHHEAAPAKHHADDEGKHHEGPAKSE
ncbi:MAG: hypothetical protein JO015_11550 [Verrucomicrobia bacterium]|nr:hypothetical protein [Verrucomicrobiota bacterium]